MKVDQVPFFRPSIDKAEINSVVEVLKSGWLTTGPQNSAFEEEFLSLYNQPDLHAISVNSATAALHLGLEAMNVGPGDEVIVPTLTFTATAEVVRYLGANPVFVDIDAETLCLDLDQVEAAVTPKSKVIMPVHFAGRPCDMTNIRKLADKHGLAILDDAAHALPSRHKGQLIGDTGAEFTAFSFYANKTMTTGEGGMLLTRNAAFADRARVMRTHGIDRDVFNRFSSIDASWMYDVVAPGFKYNLSDIAAALGRVQLRRINEFKESRARLSERYTSELKDLPLILPPNAADGDLHSWHLYVVQIEKDARLSRDDFFKELQKNRIGTSVHYKPLHKMTFWGSGLVNADYPAANRYFERCISLPLFMSMSLEEQDYVVSIIKEILE